ncbi:MAG: hypothetical protein KIT73_05025 [Burkholderiales bacterium]|nr:hypothetical protein [Burkholderiales bacterium]
MDKTHWLLPILAIVFGGCTTLESRQTGVATNGSGPSTSHVARDDCGSDAAARDRLSLDDSRLAQYAAYAASLRNSVQKGDLTAEEADRLIARERRRAEMLAARDAGVGRYAYPEN